MQTTIHVAGDRLEISRGLLPGASLYNLSRVDATHQHLLLELDDDRDIPLAMSDHIVIHGHERFSIGEGPCPADDDPCVRKPIKIVMNDAPLKHDQLLRDAKQSFDQLAALDKDFESGDGLFIDLRDVPDAQILPGMRVLVQSQDRFYTSPCGNVGYEKKLDIDLTLLRSQYASVEHIEDGPRSLVIVRSVPLCPQWSRSSTDVMVQIPQGYPMGAMDMFWVPPGLTLADGRTPKNADLIEIYAGHPWQRFSWHYPPGYQWNPSHDGLIRHMRFVRHRLGVAE